MSLFKWLPSLSNDVDVRETKKLNQQVYFYMSCWASLLSGFKSKLNMVYTTIESLRNVYNKVSAENKGLPILVSY